jgi:DNA invertase Pin-like site-specific DNA recombinase
MVEANQTNAPIRAAQYLRMSTEHQRYSLGHQAAAIGIYAAERGYEVVRSYEDAGISGLSLKGRLGLQTLLADILSGAVDFAAVLIFDVSRWGRFQDVDESAHYEFLCRRAGIRIEYCTETFDNDGSLGSTLLKQLKRAMAAEYSREFGARTSAARYRMAAKGFWQGGAPGYALRRMAVDTRGRRVGVLERGQRKIANDYRIVLVHGSPEEVETVRRIYRLFVVTGMTKVGISRLLNAEGAPPPNGSPLWCIHNIDQILSGEKYAGTNVYGKWSYPMNGLRRRRPKQDWVVVEGAFEPIVTPERFAQAQRLLRRLMVNLTDSQMIEGLRALFKRAGRLSIDLIKASPELPCAEIFRRRFGTLLEAYRLAGYDPAFKQSFAAETNRKGMTRYLPRNEAALLTDDEVVGRVQDLLAREGRLSVSLIDNDPRLPSASKCWVRFGGLRNLYDRAGYVPDHKQMMTLGVRATRTKRDAALESLALRL